LSRGVNGGGCGCENNSLLIPPLGFPASPQNVSRGETKRRDTLHEGSSGCGCKTKNQRKEKCQCGTKCSCEVPRNEIEVNMGCMEGCGRTPDDCTPKIKCIPPNTVAEFYLPLREDCSSDDINAAVREIDASSFSEGIIFLPPSYRVSGEICLNSTKRISICGDPCHPPEITSNVASCGNKEFRGVNFTGNGVYLLEDSCNDCPQPDDFVENNINCNFSFESRGQGFNFTSNMFNLTQLREFHIRMTSGRLTFEANDVNITPKTTAFSFAYYDSGINHQVSDSTFRFFGTDDCNSYSIHMVDKCTEVSSIGNNYYSNIGGELVVFEGDTHPAASVYSSHDYFEENDSRSSLLVMRDIVGTFQITSSTVYASRLVEMSTTTPRGVNSNNNSLAAGSILIASTTVYSHFPSMAPTMKIHSDFIPIVPFDFFITEIQNSYFGLEVLVTPVQLTGTEQMLLTSLSSSFRNRTQSTLQFVNGSITAPLAITWDSLRNNYLGGTNTGGTVVVGTIDPTF